MAEIRRYPWIRHLRSEPSFHVLRYRRGKLVDSGRGLAFFFAPMSSAVAEIPVETRELPFLVHGRSRDFQDVAVQGSLHYRVAEPERLGERIDFSLDLVRGRYLQQPLEQIASLLVGQCQQVAAEQVATQTVEELVAEGPGRLRLFLQEALVGLEALTALGLEVTTVRVTAISPDPELAKALETPTREHLQQVADEAVFARRALAVEKERAIAENELANQIELARREEQLIEQRGVNERRKATEAVAAKAIEVEAEAKSSSVLAAAESARIRQVEAARIEIEGERVGLYRNLEPAVMIGLAAQVLAGKLEKIEHLNITPDLLATGLQNLLSKRAAED